MSADLVQQLSARKIADRRRAAAALGRSRSIAAVPALVSALGDSHHTVRIEAAIALRRLRAKAAAQALVQALSDAHPGVRSHAAQALAWVGDASCVPALVKALEDDFPWTVRYAGLALRRIKVGAGDLLVPFILTAQNERWTALDTLIRLKDPRAHGVLLSLLSDRDEYLRTQALSNLSRVSPIKRVDEALVRGLQSSVALHRVNAVLALAKIRAKAAMPDIEKLLSDTSPDVAAAAKEALAELEHVRV